MRPLIDLAYRLRRFAMALLRWQTRGVKAMAFDPEGRLLLVRHRYGRSDLWMLPGGGIARGEAPADAVAREVHEETGCRLTGIAPIATFMTRAEGRRDTVYLFQAQTCDRPVVDGVELAAACFFALDALPDTVSPATLRRIAEWQGGRVPDGRW
ncbi:NUDIX domain-containing protein [Sphingomonas sp. CLY1604]|uniref:NUDIX domain-containing protein n=1 Tax=Sphingomonas sp. CLY1604 TaxID=3457786 RepID=UPI003FD7A0C6